MSSYKTSLSRLNEIDFLRKLEKTTTTSCSFYCLNNEFCRFFSFIKGECRLFHGGDKRPSETSTGDIRIFNMEDDDRSGTFVKECSSNVFKVPECQSDEVKFKNVCYFFKKTKATLNEARANCKDRIQTLVTIDSFEKVNFVKQHAFDLGSAFLLIGLNDEETEGVFVWEGTGKKLSNNCCWAPSDPNNFNGIEHFVIMHNSGFWLDTSKGSIFVYYVCGSKPI